MFFFTRNRSSCFFVLFVGYRGRTLLLSAFYINWMLRCDHNFSREDMVFSCHGIALDASIMRGTLCSFAKKIKFANAVIPELFR